MKFGRAPMMWMDADTGDQGNEVMLVDTMSPQPQPFDG
jgi:hypothetical protein